MQWRKLAELPLPLSNFFVVVWANQLLLGRSFTAKNASASYEHSMFKSSAIAAIIFCTERGIEDRVAYAVVAADGFLFRMRCRSLQRNLFQPVRSELL
jgi:hypothetical protein